MLLSSTSIQLILISTGVAAIAVFVVVAVPVLVDFAVNQVPLMWYSVLALLKPVYLYLILNLIIITIAASSRFGKDGDADLCDDARQLKISTADRPACGEKASTVTERQEFGDPEWTAESAFERRAVDAGAVGADDVDDKSVVASDCLSVEKRGEVREGDELENGIEDEFVIARSAWNPPKRMSSSEIPPAEFISLDEKPLVSTRFAHRKPTKSSPEGGRALKVCKPKRQETLEYTWKTITEGRPMPLGRHLKKSDTWESVGSHGAGAEVLKHATLKDVTNCQAPAVGSSPSPPSSGKLRRDSSLTHDELNRRVEAFIKKFNEEMRLQRQESLDQYMDIIGR